ncbi:MAG TPA: endo-1,4-beta-xylanase, partial [Kiritimatiellia bacterium]|nr:endo-1,4-beta-xylanase [Kiritimatiellia bacterium]
MKAALSGGLGVLAILAQGADVMSTAYRAKWSAPEVTERIERDIRSNRMAEAAVRLPSVMQGTDVTVEQLTHDFLFGGNIFLFGDLKTPEKNKRYEDTFGALFNAATVAFYWRTLEPEQGKPRYTDGSPYEYRRPPTDPVVAFCESKGINMNGHAIIYGMRRWGHPAWMPEDRKAMEPLFENHVRELAQRYKGRVQRWDVVNESIDQANRGLMPDDYTFKTYTWAMRYFPETVRFNSNDNNIYAGLDMHRRYVEIV